MKLPSCHFLLSLCLLFGSSFSFLIKNTKSSLGIKTMMCIPKTNTQPQAFGNKKLAISNVVTASFGLLTASLLKSSPARASDGPIVVLGANGNTGKLIVQELIQKGLNVKPVYREAPKMVPAVPFALADVTKSETLESAIAGSSAVIFAASASRKGGKAKEVDYIGVENVAKECVRLKVPRLVVISSGAITKPDSLGFKFTNVFGQIMEYKLKGELALQAAYEGAPESLSYAIIRPGGLVDGSPAGAGEIILNQGDTVSGEIKRSDVAGVTVAAALSKTIPRNVVFEIYEDGSYGPLEGKDKVIAGYERSGKTLGGDYEKMFEGLKSGINGL